MKLKRSFWAKSALLSAVILLASCASNPVVPVPGQKEVQKRNIYVEYYNLGESYFKLENYSKAAEYYELALNKKDQYWAAYYKLGKCYVYSSNWNSALPVYKNILKRDPENSSIKASLAYIYSMQGDFTNSISIYEDLILQQPDNQEFLENYLAVLIADNKKFEKKNAAKFTAAYENLKTLYPENKNLNTFEDKYKELMKIKEEESSETSEENAESAEVSSEKTSSTESTD